jgi:hypothetical protein
MLMYNTAVALVLLLLLMMMMMLMNSRAAAAVAGPATVAAAVGCWWYAFLRGQLWVAGRPMPHCSSTLKRAWACSDSLFSAALVVHRASP